MDDFWQYGGGPALSNENQCIECIKEGAKNAICIGDYRDRRVLMCQLAREALTGNHLDDNNLYYVSKSWCVLVLCSFKSGYYIVIGHTI